MEIYVERRKVKVYGQSKKEVIGSQGKINGGREGLREEHEDNEEDLPVSSDIYMYITFTHELILQVDHTLTLHLFIGTTLGSLLHFTSIPLLNTELIPENTGLSLMTKTYKRSMPTFKQSCECCLIRISVQLFLGNPSVLTTIYALATLLHFTIKSFHSSSITNSS